MPRKIASKEIDDPLILAWFELNTFNSEARKLIFDEVADLFTWNRKQKVPTKAKIYQNCLCCLLFSENREKCCFEIAYAFYHRSKK